MKHYDIDDPTIHVFPPSDLAKGMAAAEQFTEDLKEEIEDRDIALGVEVLPILKFNMQPGFASVRLLGCEVTLTMDTEFGPYDMGFLFEIYQDPSNAPRGVVYMESNPDTFVEFDPQEEPGVDSLQELIHSLQNS